MLSANTDSESESFKSLASSIESSSWIMVVSISIESRRSLIKLSEEATMAILSTVVAAFITGGGGVDFSVSFLIVGDVETGAFAGCFFSISSDK